MTPLTIRSQRWGRSKLKILCKKIWKVSSKRLKILGKNSLKYQLFYLDLLNSPPLLLHSREIRGSKVIRASREVA